MSGSAVRRLGPALAPFISSVGYAESSYSHARELALPSGTVQLLVNLDRDGMRTYPVEGGPRVLLRERLLAAPTPAARLDVLEAALVAGARGPLEFNEAVVAAAAALHRGASVAAAADRVGWTPKRLDRAFA